MLKTSLVSLVAVFVVAWAIASRSEATPTLPNVADSISDSEPSESEVPAQFITNDPGPREALWNYEDLKPAERAVIDRGRDTRAWRGIHDGYDAAVRGRLPIVRGKAAASRLGASELATLGVVR